MIWAFNLVTYAPLALPATTLGVTLSELQIEASDFVRLSPTVPTDATELARLNRAVDSGLRSTYYPDLVLGEKWVHSWSFFRQIREMQTLVGVQDYLLPFDVGGIEGDLTYATDKAVGPIKVRGVQFILGLRQRTTATVSGSPRFVAISPVQESGSHVQRYMMMFYPRPDASYAVKYMIYLAAQALTTTNTNPPGGVALAECLLQACRAAADKIYNDRIGQEHELFKERLRAAIQNDRRRFAPEHLGRVVDPGMVTSGSGLDPSVHWTPGIPDVSINGVLL